MEQIEATRHSLSTIEDGTSFYLKGLKFVCVCKSHPESYDVFDENDNYVADVHVRWGYVTCAIEPPSFNNIYSEDLAWGFAGEFKSGRQRIKHLNKIANEILERLEDNNER